MTALWSAKARSWARVCIALTRGDDESHAAKVLWGLSFRIGCAGLMHRTLSELCLLG